ncbi:MAG: hypothetical protein ACLQCU_13535 [Acidimicrobiales bacterium]
MTIVPAAQASPTEPSDPVDLLVPRPRTRVRMLLVALAILAVLCAVAILPPSGLFTPRLSAAAAGVEWTEAHGRSGPSLSFLVRNNGWFQATITGIGDHVAGLGNASYLFTKSSSANGPTSASWGGEALVRAHSGLEISLRFGTYDCRRINSDGVNTISIEMTDALGLSSHVSVEPIAFYQGGSATGAPVPASPDVVAWPEGLTWTACHPGSAPLALNFR